MPIFSCPALRGHPRTCIALTSQAQPWVGMGTGGAEVSPRKPAYFSLGCYPPLQIISGVIQGELLLTIIDATWQG